MPEYFEQLEVNGLKRVFNAYLLKRLGYMSKHQIDQQWEEFLKLLVKECSIVERL